MAHIRQPSEASLGRCPGRDRLRGRKILVVGGGQRTFDPATDPIGNGRATSLLCAREGATVAVADYDIASAEGTVRQIRTESGSAFAIHADITSESDVQTMIATASARLDGMDGMVLNVGIFGTTGLKTFALDEWDKILATNLRGPMLCCRHGLERMANDSCQIKKGKAPCRRRPSSPWATGYASPRS